MTGRAEQSSALLLYVRGSALSACGQGASSFFDRKKHGDMRAAIVFRNWFWIDFYNKKERVEVFA